MGDQRMLNFGVRPWQSRLSPRTKSRATARQISMRRRMRDSRNFNNREDVSRNIGRGLKCRLKCRLKLELARWRNTRYTNLHLLQSDLSETVSHDVMFWTHKQTTFLLLFTSLPNISILKVTGKARLLSYEEYLRSSRILSIIKGQSN